MVKTHRIVIAMLVAPSATTLLMIALFGYATVKVLPLHSVLMEILGALGVSYAESYVLGIPLYFLLRHLNWRSGYAYAGGAFVMGLAAFPVTLVILTALSAVLQGPRAAVAAAERHFTVGTLQEMLGMIGIGVVSIPIGMLFWLMTRPKQGSSSSNLAGERRPSG